MNPDPQKADTFAVGVTLHTKSGARIGNAIIYDVTDVANRPRFHIETDFGNRTAMFAEELEELFTPGWCSSYDEWRDDKRDLAAKHEEPE